jgi:hypothetical protein
MGGVQGGRGSAAPQEEPNSSVPRAVKSARSGSHGGRGYRYQDEVAAAVAVMGLVGELSLRSISCEGVEDVSVSTGSGPIHAQVKSRRGHLKPLGVGTVAGHIRTLLSVHADALAAD